MKNNIPPYAHILIAIAEGKIIEWQDVFKKWHQFSSEHILVDLGLGTTLDLSRFRIVQPEIKLVAPKDSENTATPLIPDDCPSDDELRELFTKEFGGPNPYYRCKECGELEPGLRDYLVPHWLIHNKI